MAQKVVIAGAVRTAIGKMGGALSNTPAAELGSIVIKEALNRAGVKPEQVDEVLMGCVIQAGLGQNVARQASIKAGLPIETPAVTLNVVCVSGLNCVNMAADLIKAGEADIVVGTHAVIQKDVEFSDLALVITDEQHRFGVNQRKTLVRKGRGVNVLVMSATPIPRTMAATVFGDMDFSIIRSRPQGRREIITRAFDKTGREIAYRLVKDELDKGNLAYIIAPSIDSEDDDLSSVMKLFEEIKKRYPGHKAELLHGRLGKEEKESAMEDFRQHKIHILVATVVIEVGIDVPDATVIVIENSERFGLAQLHQLRGRVGRSDKQSYCCLINYSKPETAVARARAMAEISDGFEISEVDYKLRGPGDVMGTLQSGNAGRDIIALCRYTDILEAAVEDADRIMSDPDGTDLGHVEEYMLASAEADNSDIL